MFKYRIGALMAILLGVLVGFFVYSGEINPNSAFKFKYGLDLDGGVHLTYRADTSQIQPSDVDGAMNSLRQTIERRINIFGVSEPIVQVEKGGLFSDTGNENRLIVELPGITDVNAAIQSIGKTPLLEFKLLTEDPEILSQLYVITASTTKEEIESLYQQAYTATGLTGSELKRANLNFNQSINGSPAVSLQFNTEGTKLLRKITSENIGRVMAIFLDGVSISEPVIQSEIPNGQAQITGDFTPEEGRQLVEDLNFGALPLPIELIETQNIGATLGENTLHAGVKALSVGVLIVMLFLILWYRLPGVIASISLAFYLIIMLFLFKSIPVVLTASGIAGLILSIGMAVDANVLIFERIKEELKKGLNLFEAIKEGNKRAWPSIRDGNLSSLISAIVLYWLSGTAVVQGFSLVFAIGILVSMLSAVLISRILLLAISTERNIKWLYWLFGKN